MYKLFFYSNIISIRKSVEEAGRSIEKAHRRLTTHLNRTDTVNEEEENTNDSNDIGQQVQNVYSHRRFSRQAE